MTQPGPNPYLPAAQREGQASGGPWPGFRGAGGPLPTAPRPSQGLAVTSLVLGICAAVVAFAPFVNVLAVLAGIAAIICGIIALRRRLGRGMALGGIVTGAVGIVVSLAMTALVLAMLHGIGEALDNGSDLSVGSTSTSTSMQA